MLPSVYSTFQAKRGYANAKLKLSFKRPKGEEGAIKIEQVQTRGKGVPKYGYFVMT